MNVRRKRLAFVIAAVVLLATVAAAAPAPVLAAPPEGKDKTSHNFTIDVHLLVICTSDIFGYTCESYGSFTATGTISDEGSAEGYVSSLWLSGQHGEIEITIENLVVRSRKKGTEQVLKGTFVLEGRSGDYEGIYVTGSAEGTRKLSWSATPQGRVDYQDIDWHFEGSL